MDDAAADALIRHSEALVSLVARAAGSLVAIRVGGAKHITGLLWRDDLVVTSDRALPAQDGYTIMLPNGSLASCRSSQRDAGANLALLNLDISTGAVRPRPGLAQVGALALALGTGADASPTARMGSIQRLVRNPASDGVAIVLNLAGPAEQGGPVLDAAGGLIGIADIGPMNETVVIPHAVIARVADGLPVRDVEQPPVMRAVGRVAPPAVQPARGGGASGRRGWLGVALQPITVPEPMVPRAGQASGRMVMSMTAGGPAERAGLQVGDVLLALNGHSASGAHALRAFMGADRIGTQIEVRLLRDGVVMLANVVVAEQPAY